MLYTFNPFEDNLNCAITIFELPEGNTSVISCEVYDIRWDINIQFLFNVLLAVNRNKVKDVIPLHRVVLAINDMPFYLGFNGNNINNISQFSTLNIFSLASLLIVRSNRICDQQFSDCIIQIWRRYDVLN